MSTTATLDPRDVAPSDGADVSRAPEGDPRYQAFMLLRIAFTVAPILFGLDKFFNVLVDWETYLAPWINDIVPGSASTACTSSASSRSLAGIFVALKPRYGAYVVAAWLGGIIINLLTYSGYYDIALRDFGLMLGGADAGAAGEQVRRARLEGGPVDQERSRSSTTTGISRSCCAGRRRSRATRRPSSPTSPASHRGRRCGRGP